MWAATSRTSSSSSRFGIFVRQAEGGGRLGADDLVALPHGLGQHAHVAGGRLAGPLDVAQRQCGPCPTAADRDAHRRRCCCAPSPPPGPRPAARRTSWRTDRRNTAPCRRCGASAASGGGARPGGGSSTRRPAAACVPGRCRPSFPAATASSACAAASSTAVPSRDDQRAIESSRVRTQSAVPRPLRGDVLGLGLDHQLGNIDGRRDIPGGTDGS